MIARGESKTARNVINIRPTESPQQKRGNFQAAKEDWLKMCASYPSLSGSDLAVVIALSTYFNSKSRDAWPSQERLAADINRNRSTVWRSLTRLESMGLIEIDHGRGWKKANRYRPKLGRMDIDPATLRRKTTPHSQMLRVRNRNAASSQH